MLIRLIRSWYSQIRHPPWPLDFALRRNHLRCPCCWTCLVENIAVQRPIGEKEPRRDSFPLQGILRILFHWTMLMRERVSTAFLILTHVFRCFQYVLGYIGMIRLFCLALRKKHITWSAWGYKNRENALEDVEISDICLSLCMTCWNSYRPSTSKLYDIGAGDLFSLCCILWTVWRCVEFLSLVSCQETGAGGQSHSSCHQWACFRKSKMSSLFVDQRRDGPMISMWPIHVHRDEWPWTLFLESF